MTVEISLAVNNEHGSVTNECQAIEVLVDGEMVMYLDLDMDVSLIFLEIPDDLIQIGNDTFKYEERATMVGNVYWNQYRILCAEVCKLLNYLKAQHDDSLWLTEAEATLDARWRSGERFTVEVFNELIANSN